MVHARGVLAGFLVFLLAGVVAPAEAQLPSQFLEVEVTWESTGIERDGRVGTFDVTVTNPTQSPFPATVTLNVSAPPPGWTASLAETVFEVTGGQSATTVLTLEAAEDVEETDIAVTLTAVAVYASPIPGVPSSPPATDTTEVTYGFERDFLAAFENQIGIPFWAVVIVVIALLAVIVLLLMRRGSPLQLAADDELLQVPAGSLAVIPVRVHNPSGKAATANLEVSGVPDGWDVELEHGSVELPPRQSAVVQVRAHVPADARGGVREMAVTAGRQSGVEDVRAPVSVEVRAAPPKAPAPPAVAPVAAPAAPVTPAAPPAKAATKTTAEVVPKAATKAARKPAAKKPASKPAKRAVKAPAESKAKAEGTLAAAAPTYSDYNGQSLPVEEIEGIGPVYGERLREAGIRTTARLCYEGADHVAKVAQVPVKTAEQWKAMVQLMKVKGVGPQYAEALARAGVRDIDALKRRKADRIASQVTTYLDGLGNNVLGTAVTTKRVEAWQEAAKSMRKTRQPIPAQ